MGRAGFFNAPCTCSIWPRNSGRCFSTGSLTESRPASASIMMAVPVKGLVIDMIWKIESLRMGFLFSMSCQPTASKCTNSPFCWNRVTVPAMRFCSTSSRIRPAILANWPESAAQPTATTKKSRKRMIGYYITPRTVLRSGSKRPSPPSGTRLRSYGVVRVLGPGGIWAKSI